ncbi:hypothetical protein RND71_026703 [Anisodus tanguticus]|uniref:Fatty acid desaturase domain-containing protein n=1 Tax=Anisodus tanguticus TaxID=243964 RepID=A0AAE1RLB5_9SOLA|nr:hypothetical protein RND71_026703 [Anisodus tanguticus]
MSQRLKKWCIVSMVETAKSEIKHGKSNSTFTRPANNVSKNWFQPGHTPWSIYWIVQGCVCIGIWVIAHECGHQAFSDYPWINDTVGLILHSALLAPYFSWKYSHRHHHSNTGSLERDENYVPKFKSQLRWYTKVYPTTR